MGALHCGHGLSRHPRCLPLGEPVAEHLPARGRVIPVLPLVSCVIVCKFLNPLICSSSRCKLGIIAPTLPGGSEDKSIQNRDRAAHAGDPQRQCYYHSEARKECG